MATVRICTIVVPRFVHDGLEVVGAWRPVDLAKLTKPARQALIDYVGVFVQVHPEDVSELAKAGLEFFAGANGKRRLRVIPAASPKVTKG